MKGEDGQRRPRFDILSATYQVFPPQSYSLSVALSLSKAGIRGGGACESHTRGGGFLSQVWGVGARL